MSRFQAVFPEDRSEIDLSPMLDVVFIMLVFFVLVATFIREDGIRVRDTAVAVGAGYATGIDVVTIIPFNE